MAEELQIKLKDLLTVERLKSALARGDLIFAFGLMGILVVLIMPLPSWLLDICLAFSLTFSILVLMTTLFIERPLEFSSFPTVLLVSTMLRLALNVASTRLILTYGHTGASAAGEVIDAFGHFVMSGSFVIGIIVFSILVIVNFVVITKGSGRIAEVSARFSLDAMPGKQMAIDADLSAGMITEEEARKRRKTLEEESSFFGAMDGAAKFVRGDAIAGLLITFINIIAGIIIGVAQREMSFLEAAESFTLLTVGDGLVTQIPALVVSTAAGMLVSKAGVVGSTEKALFGQLAAYPTALGMSSFLMGGMALIPGVPAFPFLLLGGMCGAAAWAMGKKPPVAEGGEVGPALEGEGAAPPTEEGAIASALQIDQLRLELGYGLISMINNTQGMGLTEQIKILRRQLAGEIGFVLPAVRIQDNLQLPSTTYVIQIKEFEAGRADLRPHMILAMDPEGKPITLAGEATREPSFGLPAMWISTDLKEEAESLGYTVVDASTVLTTHLTEVVKDNVHELLSLSEVQKLLDDLGDSHKKLVQDLIPGQVSLSSVQRVLKNLLAERVSIRDLSTILEGISEAATFTRNTTLMTEHVRSRLARQISMAHLNSEGVLPLVTLSPEWEKSFNDSIVGEGEGRQLAMAPSKLQDFIRLTRQAFDHQNTLTESPILLTTPTVRPYVRSIVERFRPITVVMSQTEVHPKVRIKTVAQIQ
jgi:flagellar biosynthesis protein FlhA